MSIEQSVLAVRKYVEHLQGELLNCHAGTKAACTHLLECLGKEFDLEKISSKKQQKRKSDSISKALLQQRLQYQKRRRKLEHRRRNQELPSGKKNRRVENIVLLRVGLAEPSIAFRAAKKIVNEFSLEERQTISHPMVGRARDAFTELVIRQNVKFLRSLFANECGEQPLIVQHIHDGADLRMRSKSVEQAPHENVILPPHALKWSRSRMTKIQSHKVCATLDLLLGCGDVSTVVSRLEPPLAKSMLTLRCKISQMNIPKDLQSFTNAALFLDTLCQKLGCKEEPTSQDLPKFETLVQNFPVPEMCKLVPQKSDRSALQLLGVAMKQIKATMPVEQKGNKGEKSVEEAKNDDKKVTDPGDQHGENAPFKKGDKVILSVKKNKSKYDQQPAEVEQVLKGKCKIWLSKLGEWKTVPFANLSLESEPVSKPDEKPTSGKKPLDEILGDTEDV